MHLYSHRSATNNAGLEREILNCLETRNRRDEDGTICRSADLRLLEFVYRTDCCKSRLTKGIIV
jgi:hypothetical protein